MEGRSALAGFARYVAWWLSVVIFPIALWRALRTARGHTDMDPRAGRKVLGATGLAFVLLAGGAYAAVGFHQSNVDGIWDFLDGRMSVALGNEDYKAAVDAGDADGAAALRGNHDLYTAVSARLAAHDGDGALALIEARHSSVEINEEGVERSFGVKDDSIRGLGQVMWFLVYPGLAGVFYAPIVMALGSSLRRNWVPSESVGFKPYPSGAAGLFLLFGAFGIPSTFFAAWTLKDIEDRTVEGQISL